VSRRKGQAKRRRRTKPKLTPEQKIALEVSRRAAENHRVARAERARRQLLEVIGVEAEVRNCAASDLTRWELCELARLNAHRSLPLLVLPDSAYEARRLMRYVEVGPS
jgi:hypothetical protein